MCGMVGATAAMAALVGAKHSPHCSMRNNGLQVMRDPAGSTLSCRSAAAAPAWMRRMGIWAGNTHRCASHGAVKRHCCRRLSTASLKPCNHIDNERSQYGAIRKTHIIFIRKTHAKHQACIGVHSPCALSKRMCPVVKSPHLSACNLKGDTNHAVCSRLDLKPTWRAGPGRKVRCLGFTPRAFH